MIKFWNNLGGIGKFIIGLILLSGIGVGLFFAFSKGKNILQQNDPNYDRWSALRDKFGRYGTKEGNYVWGIAAVLFEKDFDPSKDRNEEIGKYFHSVLAWHKGWDMVPDGWTIKTDKKLADEIVDWVNNNHPTNANTMKTGSLIS